MLLMVLWSKLFMHFDEQWPSFAPALLQAIVARMRQATGRASKAQEAAPTAPTPNEETSGDAAEGDDTEIAKDADGHLWDNVYGLQWLAFMFSVGRLYFLRIKRCRLCQIAGSGLDCNILMPLWSAAFRKCSQKVRSFECVLILEIESQPSAMASSLGKALCCCL